MELLGIVFSIPVAFVMSMVYCAILANAIRRCEVALLTTLGAGVIGPAFYVAHVVFFFLGTPALANVLLLRKRCNTESPRRSTVSMAQMDLTVSGVTSNIAVQETGGSRCSPRLLTASVSQTTADEH